MPYKILLVDDDVPLLKFYKLKISKHIDDCEFFLCKDGLEALEVFQNTKVDLIFSDISMPKLTGLELCKIIKKTHPHTPFILLSCQFSDKGLESNEACADFIINKLSFEEFLSNGVMASMLSI
jgi:YesN/AraC family two-component response regulator